jgi:hypothetical protein
LNDDVYYKDTFMFTLAMSSSSCLLLTTLGSWQHSFSSARFEQY